MPQYELVKGQKIIVCNIKGLAIFFSQTSGFAIAKKNQILVKSPKESFWKFVILRM